MKMNKKGFTLIEMLVVIAIIAVLVAIIIPTVTSATTKAEAASNAANLRSLKAEITTQILLSDEDFSTSGIDFTAPDPDSESSVWTASVTEDFKVSFNDLKATDIEFSEAYTAEGTFAADGGLDIDVDADDVVTITYDGLTIADWSDLAK